MKIVLTAASPNIEADVDSRFGRGAYLLMVDTESLQWESHRNPGVNAVDGSGIQTAQFVSEQKVSAVLSGNFGPHAVEALQSAGIAMYLYGDCGTAHEAIERFKAGELKQVGT